MMWKPAQTPPSLPRDRSPTAGVVRGLARRPARRAPMQTLTEVSITPAAGLEGDSKGVKFLRRQVTILSVEDWEDACRDAGAPALPWTARRANLLVAGLLLPRARGAILGIGTVRLEVTGQTSPCRRMEEVHRGLLKALFPDWRGGLTCRVLEGGRVCLGDPVAVLAAPQWELPLPLPG
ncbi:MAG: MOSC domain-containing protein [Hyphomicrobiaceae bacterium]|nr:MOSC domain-containing protein [Hyphomicrobiaceae bacterium]